MEAAAQDPPFPSSDPPFPSVHPNMHPNITPIFASKNLLDIAPIFPVGLCRPLSPIILRLRLRKVRLGSGLRRLSVLAPCMRCAGITGSITVSRVNPSQGDSHTRDVSGRQLLQPRAVEDRDGRHTRAARR